MRDAAILGCLLVSFATLVTAHVVIVVRLGAREPRYRAPLALLVPPLAPYWAATNKWRRSEWCWLAAVLLYALSRVAAEL